ncbi:FliA/WhiG family RNA polymerase sigma factor [Massilia sp. LC238]|uniref:FliA/WhiG family RNA polymerase sigma factor n=1 Tax=Massilia sp. LC238 TaxID=1502852 RepID=UPI0004E3D8FD|nr:FliA/WhiG family RNA polymerase sigma factor [Massilia sp. LC238]KFC61867.1 FliA/WhiG family RNA polymerase sigma factor [Massilia sp. LC238]
MAYLADYADTNGASLYGEAPANAGMTPGEEQRHLLAYAPLVKRIVRQLNSQVSGTVSREDMEQIGLMGLLEALRRYGTPDVGFGSYASLRVRGAILDELRRQDWRPRAVRQDSHRVRDELRALTRKLGREPLEKEAAAALGVTLEEFRQHVLDDCAEEMLSFDEVLQEALDPAHSAPSPEEAYLVRRSLEQVLGSLNEKEQRVIQMIYEFELSYKEIAAVLDLSDARVCQLNKSALAKMKAALQRA